MSLLVTTVALLMVITYKMTDIGLPSLSSVLGIGRITSLGCVRMVNYGPDVI